MQLRALGRTGVQVSEYCLGAMMFGSSGNPDHDDCARMTHRALDAGVNFIDTADVYSAGESEEIVGKAIKDRRDEVVLATKFHAPMGKDPNMRGNSRRWILQEVENSLRRLGTDWIDLYQMHEVDRAVSWVEVWEAMETLLRQGKIRYVGSSNFAGWDIVSAQEAAHRQGLLGLASEQCCYNLVTRHTELEVLPAAAARGLGVLVWSPLHGGLLGGVLRKLADGTAVKSAQGRAVAALEHHRDTVADYERFCAKIGRDPAEVAVAWTLANPHVTAILTGPRMPSQLDAAFRALEHELSEDELGQLDELFPPIGRGGPAPQAWMT